jgi:hypothetical protein
MERIPHQTNFWLLGTIILLAAGVFALDLSFPLGVAVGVLYAVPVLVSLWIPRRRYTIVAAMAGTALTVLDLFISPLGNLVWIVIVNRAFSLFVVWATVILVLLHKQQTERIKTLSGLIPICAACKDMGRHGVLEPSRNLHQPPFRRHLHAWHLPPMHETRARGNRPNSRPVTGKNAPTAKERIEQKLFSVSLAKKKEWAKFGWMLKKTANEAAVRKTPQA